MIQPNEALANLSKSSNVFLQTLTVLVEGGNARNIIDSGSQRSHILKTVAEKINATEEYSCHFEAFGQEVICDSISRKRGSHFKELGDYSIQKILTVQLKFLSELILQES
ncbi:hypothetical protein NPIL_548471 [Nephila pilipes]|uniref:Uncharacterized protein n=1 Tax=Nephila pilipes TaxID=299642 RepID=A0A8X6PR65_NEPPI|nr:hypothetical protein NPIL_548471 [Nephila pilipes]